MNIGKKIKKYRKEKGLTQLDLATKSNMSRSYLADVENNRYNPSVDTIKSIANALDVPMEEFFKEGEEAEVILNEKDEKDIEKALSSTLNKLETAQDGLMFDGEPIDDETRELLRISLENSMRLAKQIAKKKYTPNKHKK